MDSYFHKLLITLAALRHPGAWRALFTSRAFSPRCIHLNFVLKCHQPHLGTILDVGANVGQFALGAALHFRDARIYSFEPLPDAYRELLQNTRGIGKIEAFHCALGSSCGQLPFHRNRYSRLSSSLSIDAGNDHPRYVERKTNRIHVDVFTLDDVVQSLSMPPPVLLKLDVQGMEMEVLNGCKASLKHMDFLLVETALVRLYERQPLFDEMHRQIRELGYTLVAPLFLNRGKGGKIIEMDVLYRKTST